MTHHDGISDDHHDETPTSAEHPREEADFVHPVDHGAGTIEESLDGSVKGDFTTSTDHGDGHDAPPNDLREDGEFVSGADGHDGVRGDDYVDPVDHG